MVKTPLINIVKLFLITSLLTSCAGIPGEKIKLKNYPEVNGAEAKNLNLTFELKNRTGPNKILESKFIEFDIKQSQKNQKNGCKVVSVIYAGNDLLTCPFITNIIAPFTLFTIPYYCQAKYQAKATLIHLSQSPILDINGNPIKNPISPNPIEEKVLKEYYLEDKVHEVWSLFFIFGSFGIENKYIDVGRHPEDAKNEVEQTLSQALTRQILHDASQFPECIKTQQDRELEKQLAEKEKKQQEAIKKEQELRRSKIKGKSNINLKLQKDFSLSPASLSSPTTP